MGAADLDAADLDAADLKAGGLNAEGDWDGMLAPMGQGPAGLARF